MTHALIVWLELENRLLSQFQIDNVDRIVVVLQMLIRLKFRIEIWVQKVAKCEMYEKNSVPEHAVTHAFLFGSPVLGINVQAMETRMNTHVLI